MRSAIRPHTNPVTMLKQPMPVTNMMMPTSSPYDGDHAELLHAGEVQHVGDARYEWDDAADEHHKDGNEAQARHREHDDEVDGGEYARC